MLKVQLKEITKKIGSGATPTGGQNAYHSEGIALIRSQNVYDFNFSMNGLAFIDDKQAKELDNVEVFENDILLNITGDSIARVCKVPTSILPARVNQHVAIIRCNNDVDSNYLLSYLINLKPYLLKICGVGGTRNALTKAAIEKLEIVLPVINEQIKIGSLISVINAKIELNNKINAELEAMAKTMYDYWFVQFDFPNAQGKPYKSSGGKMVWNEQLKREIPEGWEVGTFGTYAKSKGGFAFKSEWWQDEGIPVIKIKDIQENYTLDLNGISYVDVSKLDIAKAYEAKAGDVVIAMTGATVGKYAIVPLHSKPILVNQRVALFDLGNEPINSLPFLINSLNQEYFREQVFTLASGAAQPNISNTQIDNIPLVIPNKKLTNDYNLKLVSTYKTILNNQLQNQQLTQLRDWLLPMLMNGQVTVKEAYAMVDEQLSEV